MVRPNRDYTTEARLYTALVGLSGVGKGECMKNAQRDFEEADGNRYQLSIEPGVGSGEALLEAVAAATDHQLLFQPDELVHVAIKIKIEGQSLMNVLLSGLEGNPASNRVKGQAIGYVTDGGLSILTSCTDAAFVELFATS